MITSTPVTTATAGQSYSYTVTATDPDLDDTQTYSLDVMPDGMTIDATTGVIDWTPTMAQFGDNAVTVTVTDFNGLTDSQTYTVTVAAPVGSVFFSTLNNVVVPGVTGTNNNADIYAYDGSVFSRILDSGFSGNMDGLHVVDANRFYISFNNNTAVTNGGVTLEDEDIGFYDNGTWSLAFQGSTVCGGLQGNNGLDIDAFDVVGGVLYFTTAGNTALPAASGVGPGLGNAWDNSDIYRWDGATCTRIFDRDQSGVGGSNVDGLTVVDATHFYLSFVNTTVSVPGVGNVQDEDVVFNNGGIWSVYFEGTAEGLTADGARPRRGARALNRRRNIAASS